VSLRHGAFYRLREILYGTVHPGLHVVPGVCCGVVDPAEALFRGSAGLPNPGNRPVADRTTLRLHLGRQLLDLTIQLGELLPDGRCKALPLVE
jgi:hypothetical protein